MFHSNAMYRAVINLRDTINLSQILLRVEVFLFILLSGFRGNVDQATLFYPYSTQV